MLADDDGGTGGDVCGALVKCFDVDGALCGLKNVGLEKLAEQLADDDGRTGDGGVGGDVEDACVERFDVHGDLVAFERVDGLADGDGGAVGDEPARESAFFHGPAETRNGDVDRHIIRGPGF